MITVGTVCLVLALVCFVVAAIWKPNPPKIDPYPLGWAFVMAAYLFGVTHIR
jgi:hypothetical protein